MGVPVFPILNPPPTLSCHLSAPALSVLSHASNLAAPVFLPGEFHGQRSLAGYSPWSHKESDTTYQLNKCNELICSVNHL